MDWKVTATRLKKLREERGLSHRRLSEKLSSKYPDFTLTDQTLMKYEVCDDNHKNSKAVNSIKAENIWYFADFYGVTTDYLLGRSDCKNIYANEVLEKTGLEEESVQVLTEYAQNKESGDPFLYGLNYLLKNELQKNSSEKQILKLIINYLCSGSKDKRKIRIDENGIRIKKTSGPKDLFPATQMYFDEFDADQIISTLYLADLNECLKNEKSAFQNSKEYFEFLKCIKDYKKLEMQRFFRRYADITLSTFERNKIKDSSNED